MLIIEHDHFAKVEYQTPIDPYRGANGRTCGGLGRGTPRPLGGSVVDGGRTPERPSWVGGVLAVTEPRDEDQVREGRGVPNQVEVRRREDRNEITTFRQY